MNRILSLFLLLIALVQFVSEIKGQDTLKFSAWGSENSFKNYFTNGISDIKDVCISLVKWEKSQWIGAGVVIAGGFLLTLTDEEITDFFRRNQNHTLNSISGNFLAPLGEEYVLIPISAIFYADGMLSKSIHETDIGLQGLKSLAIAVGVTTIFKYSTHRYRPHETDPMNAHQWEGPSFDNDHLSFPSGHAARTFTMAALISSAYHKPWITITAYSLASLVSISRVYESEHWASDVFIGAAIGYGIGKLVWNNHKKRHSGIQPIFYGNQIGLRISVNQR